MPLGFIIVLGLLLSSVFAGEATPANPDNARAATVDLPPDSSPTVLKKDKATPDSAPARNTNDPEMLRPRASLPDDSPASSTVKKAEPIKLDTPRTPPAITTTDPEFQRPRVIDPDDTAVKPEAPTHEAKPAPVPFKAQAGDPERLRRFESAEDVAGAVQSGAISVLEGVAVRRAMNEDRPRFPKGEGLDDEAAEAAARNALAQKKAKAPVAPGEESAELVELPETPAKKKSGGNEPFDELVELARKNQGIVRDIAGEKEKPQPANPKEREKRRAERAEHLLDALSNGTALSKVSGVVTDASGKVPVAARIKITDAAGATVEAPLEDGFYTPGQFAAETIPGMTKIEIHRGRFFSTSSTTLKASGPANPPISVAVSQSANLNFARMGWYIADLDIGLRAEPGERSVWRGPAPKLEDLLLAAEAEGVNAIGVQLPRNDPEEAARILKLASGTGVHNGILVLPTFPGPRHVFQGVAYGLGVQDAASLPWEINDPAVPLREAFEDIRAQGGLAVYKNLNGYATADIKSDLHPLIPQLRGSGYFHERDTRAKLYAAAGLPFETVTGPGYDALAFDGSPAMEQIWFNLLNQGQEVPIVGAGGGSMEGGRRPYGQTLVYGGPKLTRASILEGIKQGKTMVSYGPAVFARIVERDKTPGDWLPADGRKVTLQIQAYSSMVPGMQLDRVDIIRNGKVLHTQVATEGETSLTNLNWAFMEDTTAWYVLRVTERRNTTLGAQKGGMAWSSPLYFRGASHAPKLTAQSRITGTLRSGPSPLKGAVTLVVPGEPEREVETDANGRFSLLIPSQGALVFHALGHEPVAKRVCEHPDVLKLFGELQSERNGALLEQLAKPSLLSRWRLQLSELTWEIGLERSK